LCTKKKLRTIGKERKRNDHTARALASRWGSSCRSFQDYLAAFLIELDHTFGIFSHHLKTIRHDSSDSPLLRRVFPIAVILFYLAELVSATVSGTKP
jgi:hypothetical protein